MALTDDIRKAVTDPKPLYFAAGTADLAVQQARRVPELFEKLQAEAPGRIDAVRNTDPKAVQEKAAARAKEVQEVVQAKVTEVFGGFDTDLKKIGESAQDLALRGVGVAAEYAVKAREMYDEVSERGEQAVKTWRGEAAEEIEEIAIAVEGKEGKKEGEGEVETGAGEGRGEAKAKAATAEAGPADAKPADATSAEAKPVEAKAAPARKAAAKKAPARKAAAKKTTPPAK